MLHLRNGTYFGVNKKSFLFENVILTETEYTHDRVDWHYHENAYFTYIVKGHILEANKKETYDCTPGTLLFHHWQDPHYNIKYPGYARGFHIELRPEWFSERSFDSNLIQGSIHLNHPLIKSLFHKIYLETKINDTATPVSVEDLLMQIFGNIIRYKERIYYGTPEWVNKIKEILHDRFADQLCLKELSHLLGIHPVHLSREFPKYFFMTLGDYIRSVRVERAVFLLNQENISSTEIAYRCGFSDQSHFIRCFKKSNGLTPERYRKCRGANYFRIGTIM